MSSLPTPSNAASVGRVAPGDNEARPKAGGVVMPTNPLPNWPAIPPSVSVNCRFCKSTVPVFSIATEYSTSKSPVFPATSVTPLMTFTAAMSAIDTKVGSSGFWSPFRSMFVGSLGSSDASVTDDEFPSAEPVAWLNSRLPDVPLMSGSTLTVNVNETVSPADNVPLPSRID